MQKPANLIYGVDDKPPLFITGIMGIQHVCTMFIGMIFPVIIIRQLSGTISPEQAQNFISMSLIAGGIATIIQSLKKGPVGSGYLCPSLSGPSYLNATVSAAATGGLPLVFGMTALSGFLEILFSKVMHKLRFLFPVEVTGLIVAMVGIVIIPLSIRNFFGIQGSNEIILNQNEIFVAAFTLSIMVGINIWSKGKLKLFCTLCGMVAGYILSIIFNIIPGEDISRLSSASYFSVPNPNTNWNFDFSLLIPFIVATICSSFKTVGDIVTCQRVNDTGWKRPDLKNLSKGIFADGLGGMIPGILGGYGQSTSSSNIGLSIATGTTSRVIAYLSGTIFIVLAFFPKLAEIFIIMPKPVIGATLVFSVSFMITTGFQIMMSRMLDTRKIFVIGISIIFGYSVDAIPGLYAGIHPWIKPVFSSSLSLAAVTAIILNLIFRIGIAKQKSLVINPDKFDNNLISDFMEVQGGLWGARKDVINKSIIALNETIETLISYKMVSGDLTIDTKFDEFNLDIKIIYSGESFSFFDNMPSDEDLEDTKLGTIKLSGYIIKKSIDKLHIKVQDNKNIISFHFDH